MTTIPADLAWLKDFPGRCPTCLLHESQGHRAPCEFSGPLGLLLARKARDKGMSATVAAHPDAVTLIDAAIMRRIRAGQVFSANTIRIELTSLTASERPVIGARMNSLARTHCEKVGDEPSTDPGTHGKTVARWLPKRSRVAA